MIHPSPTLLDEADPATAFLTLRWTEFFDGFTIDSFQPKLCNLPALVEEIHEVCSPANLHQSSGAHLSALQCELAAACAGAHERGWVTDFEEWKLNELRKAQTAPEAARVASVFVGDEFRSKFESRILSEAKRLPELLPKEKHVADVILGQLATIALRRGYFGSEDYETIKKHFTKSPDSWVDGLLSRLQSRPQEFLVVIELVSTEKIQAGKLAPIMEKGGFKVEDPARFPAITPLEKSVLISITEFGTSPASALQTALRRAEPILDMFAYYLADRAATLPDHGWVGKNADDLVETNVPLQSLRLVHPHRYADRLVGQAIDSGAGARLEGSVSNALELNSTAMRSTDVRTRFLNLWAALECLASLVDEPTILRRITELVCPVVTWRKIEKLGRYISINLHLWAKKSGQKGERRLTTEDVISALCKPENDPEILALFARAKKHPLLCYRIFQTWKTFHDPQALSKGLAESKERVDWHLRRIYRARNLLVHRGIESLHLQSLCDNLHYYVHIVLSRVIHGVSMNDRWNPEDAVKYWKLTSDYVSGRLRQSPESLLMETLVPNPAPEKASIQPWAHLSHKISRNETTVSATVAEVPPPNEAEVQL